MVDINSNMAADFIGANVLVFLQAPPNAAPGAPPLRVEGIVGDIVGQRLSLRDALLWNGQRVPLYYIDSTSIADLEIQKSRENELSSIALEPHGTTQATPRAYSKQYTPASSTGDPSTTTKPPPQSFVDPAILSYSRPPLSAESSNTFADHEHTSKLTPSHTSETIRAKGGGPRFSHSVSSVSASSTLAGGPEHGGIQKDSMATATLHEPFSHLELNGESELDGFEVTRVENEPTGRFDVAPLETTAKYTGKRSRRGKNRPTKDMSSQTSTHTAVKEDAAAPQRKTQFKTEGWRQTPFTKEAREDLPYVPPGEPSATPKVSRKKGGRRRQKVGEEQNGWATEDATDIQDLGEFDFASNLSKFDKRKVFDQIRNDDTTADEDRLVSFNRKSMPGTNGGRNLHYTENVLDSPVAKPKWISEDSDEAEHAGSGGNSRRPMSRTSTRHMSSRKGSAILSQPAAVPPLHASSIGRAQYSSSRTESPRPSKNFQSASPLNGSGVVSSRGTLRLERSNKNCPCISPLQMLEVEQLSISELGFSEDMITENAGRGIAEAALTQAVEASYSTSILVLAGNHKTGARAVAAARHLYNHNVRITVCILGAEREHELLDSLRRQLELYWKIGGRVSKWDDLSGKLTSSEWTMDLVIDALLGMHLSFEDLRTDDSSTTFQMISWVNRSEANILSVDVPSGLLATSGEVTTIDSGPLLIRPHFVVSLGTPKTGLLSALIAEVPGSASWQLSVADIGISNAAWKKYGSRRRHGVDWASGWVAGVKFVGGSSG